MSSSKNLEIAKGSFLSKSNSVFIEEMYLRFLEKDPSLPVSWKSYFVSLGEEIDTVVKEIEGPTWKPNKKKINIQEYKENFEEDQINNINNEENKVSFEISKSDTIKAIVFAHKDDVFEDPKTLSFFANFKGMRLIDYSELKPTKCTWADGDEKMPSNKGHNIPQSKCFTKYLEETNYLISWFLGSRD